MIRGMKRSKSNLLRPILGVLCLVLSADASSLPLQSTPEIDVMVYGFPALSPSLLRSTESEAALLLRPAPMKLKWTDCTRSADARCMSPQAETDPIVRFVPKALPSASADALGVAGSSGGYATAFIFFGRVLALRTKTRSLSVMCGRVLAHEIVHLLLPYEDHSRYGLMRGQWSADDLNFASSDWLGLPARWIGLIQREALRRTAMRDQ